MFFSGVAGRLKWSCLQLETQIAKKSRGSPPSVGDRGGPRRVPHSRPGYRSCRPRTSGSLLRFATRRRGILELLRAFRKKYQGLQSELSVHGSPCHPTKAFCWESKL